MMYEDAKISKRNIYTAYSDFKGAFGGMDHRILFQLMKEYGFQDSYIEACKQLYSASTNTLSSFLFTIFMEPLLRWLDVGSRGYKPTYQPRKATSTINTYDGHGYADDMSITAGTNQDIKIQLKKLHLFSQYTVIQLETSKCEAIGSLWGHGNSLSHKKT